MVGSTSRTSMPGTSSGPSSAGANAPDGLSAAGQTRRRTINYHERGFCEASRRNRARHFPRGEEEIERPALSAQQLAGRSKEDAVILIQPRPGDLAAKMREFVPE